MMLLLDRFARPLKKVRVSVTSRCNIRCVYCHAEGLGDTFEGAIRGRSFDEASPREFAALVARFARLGVREVKITGGEPTIRQDLEEIILRMSQIDGIDEVSLVTNGTMLYGRASDLKDAGLSRVNVNFPTVNPKAYRELTGFEIDAAMRGLRAAKEAGLHPIKLNVLILRGFNETRAEFERLLRFAADNGFVPQVLELEAQGWGDDVFDKYHTSLDGFHTYLDSRAIRKRRRSMHKRIIYELPGGLRVEMVDPWGNSEFCSNCSRVRIAPDLQLKSCLLRTDNWVPSPHLYSESETRWAILEVNRRREPYFSEETRANFAIRALQAVV
ncbi:MAG: GTP 3',8-cyclase MoaA [Candidatus Geothermarchaeales archaeon]